MANHNTTLFLLALLLTTVACSIFIGGPEYPEERIPISTESTESLQTNIQDALSAGAESGFVTLEISEEQISSYVAYKLATQENPIFYDPQIYLRDDQIKIFGKVENGNFVANILITLTASIDENGKPTFIITSADFGPFPAPEGLKQTLTALITEAYTGSLGPVASGFRLESIEIQDRTMTVAGRIK
jgi:hypothetical protein